MVANKNGQGTMVVRCQHSHPVAADTFADVGIKGPPAKYVSGGASDLTFAFDIATGWWRTSNPLRQPALITSA
jgi:hypothetical protein